MFVAKRLGNLVVCMSILAGGCSTTPPPATLTLPATDLVGFCRGLSLDATLVGDPTDERLTWLVSRSTGARRDLVWPTGYVARFVPEVEVLDERGRVAFRAGDAIVEGCLAVRDSNGNDVLRIAP